MHDDSIPSRPAPPFARGSRRLAAMALAATLACGLAGTAGAQPTAAERPSAAKSATATKAEPATGAKWKAYFSAEEIAAWEQKIAAAPDEAERRRIRGLRLAEIRRRTNAQQGGGAAPPPKAASTAQRPQ